MAHSPTELKGPVVFFDGECLFCSRAVRSVAALDKNAALRFAPLQGTTAAGVLPAHVIRDLEAVVYWDGGQWLSGSDAAIAALRAAGGPGPWLATLLRVCPRPVREMLYRQVARNRRKLFGAQVCALPEPGQTRFLP